MARYRATRTEPRVAVGNGKAYDLTKGTVYESGKAGVPEAVAQALVDSGLFIPADKDAKDNPWFDSDDPDLAGAG